MERKSVPLVSLNLSVRDAWTARDATVWAKLVRKWKEQDGELLAVPVLLRYC